MLQVMPELKLCRPCSSVGLLKPIATFPFGPGSAQLVTAQPLEPQLLPASTFSQRAGSAEGEPPGVCPHVVPTSGRKPNNDQTAM